MTDDTFDTTMDARDGTIELVSAYVSNSNNRLTGEELQALIRDTFATLSSLSVGTSDKPEVETGTHEKSKAEIRKSIGPDSLISFEDGRAYKSLKRHLNGRRLTPVEYRAKYGLPADYPMTHPTYSARRSELAKTMGLGSKGRQAKASAASAASAPAATTRKPRAAKTAPAE